MSKIPAHSDMVRYDYECDELNGIELACFFDYEPEERAPRDGYGLPTEPDYPETWTLVYVYLPDGLDISGVLHESIREDIQERAVNYFDTQKEDF